MSQETCHIAGTGCNPQLESYGDSGSRVIDRTENNLLSEAELIVNYFFVDDGDDMVYNHVFFVCKNPFFSGILEKNGF